MKKFIKNPANPVFGDRSTGTMFDALIKPYSGETTVLDAPRFRMDVSWRPQRSLAVSFSEDGVRWTAPEITLKYDETSGWEDDLNRNAVVKCGDTYKMWYTGQYLNHTYSAIGYAESDDGIRFHRVSETLGKEKDPRHEPVLIPEFNWEGASVMNPCVIYENGVYRMYYSAGETVEPNVIAYAESKDGIRWKKSRINPVLIHNGARDYEKDRIGGCQVLYVEELGYLMFYIGYKDIDTACICCALSKDGKTQWRRCKGNPLVVPHEGEWDADSCYKPTAIFDEEKGGWHIWYNGRKGCDEYIGEAFMEGTFTADDFE